MAGIQMRRLRSVGEQLELRLALTSTVLVPHTLPVSATVDSPVAVGDINADGRLDLVATTALGTAWFQKGDPVSENYDRAVIEDFAALELLFAELDGDAVDELVAVRAAETTGLEVVVIKNADGKGAFSDSVPIAALPFSTITELTPVDFDADGDLDLMVSGSDQLTNANIYWLRNEGDLSFEIVPIEESINAVTPSLDVFDFDGDGDLDVLSSYDPFLEIGFPVPSPPSGPDTLFFWYEQADDGTFAKNEVSIDPIPGLNAGSAMLDGDGDGDMDFFRTSYFRSTDDQSLTLTLGWFKNNDGSFGDEIVIDRMIAPAGINANVPLLVEFFGNADLLGPDLVGKPDIILGLDGVGVQVYLKDDFIDEGFALVQTEFEGEFVGPLAKVDFDQDGDLDVVTISSGEVRWLENRLVGDVDQNDRVEFADFLVIVDNFGEEVEPWTEGDFDGDGLVGFADFLRHAANFAVTREV